MNAVIPAGGIPQPDHPLYAYTKGGPRALIKINGRPMLQYIVDALDTAATVDEMIVVGLPQNDQTAVTTSKPLHFLPDHGSVIGNVKAGLEWIRAKRPQETEALICSADVPNIKGYMVDELVGMCAPFEYGYYYTVATPEMIEARYPQSQRTYTKLAHGVEIAGGDVFVAQIAMLDTSVELWESLTNARKNAWKIARVVGLWTLLKLVTRRLSLEDAAVTGSRVLGKPVKVIFVPYAELAMDADKPHQIELLAQNC